MGTSISPLGWLIIILLVVFVIGINVNLLTGLKNKSNKHSWVNSLRTAGQNLINPFQDEISKMEELSRKVAMLKTSDKSTEDIAEIKIIGEEK